MVNVCWQCGDIGLIEALVLCTECRSAARHRYCLEEVPKDLSAEISWLCEDCRSTSSSSVSMAKFPTLTSLGIFHHGSATPQIEPRNTCQEISSANDHLVNSQHQHPISNILIGSSVNPDNHIPHDLKRKTLSCANDGALDTISSSVGFKENDGGVEEIDNEKSKKERLMLSDKDKLDKSQPLVEAPGANIQCGAKRLPYTSIEAADKLMIGGTSNCDIGGLGRSSVCSGLKEDETDESEKEKPKRGLIIPGKAEVNNHHPLVNGEGTNFPLHVKRMPSTSFEPSDSRNVGSASCATYKFCAVGSFACYKQEVKEEIEQYEKSESKNGLNLQTNNFHSLINNQGSSISYVVKKPSGTPVEQSDSHAGRTLNSDINTSNTITSSTCLTLKEDAIQEYGKGNPNQRLIEPYKDMMDTSHSGIDGQGTNMSFEIERVVCTSINNKTLKRTSCCETNALGAVGSSNCFKFKRDQIEEPEDKPMIRRIKPGMNQLDDIPPINVQVSRIKFATKRCPGTSIGEPNKLTMGSTSSCSIGALGVLRSYARFGPNEGDIKAHIKTRRKRRKKSRRRRFIPQDKGARNNFHSVNFGQGNNIPVVAEKVQGTPVEVPDNLIKGRSKTSDTLDNRYGEDKSKSRSVILPTKDELNSLHRVIDRRGTNNDFATKRLPGTLVEPSDRHTIKWVNTNTQIKFPSRLASPSFPVVHRVWRGCFNINKAEVGPLSAHLSSKACLKVRNFARKLPLVLHMQKLPRLVAWPNSFKVSSPTDDNVALYFFAESERVETVLDDLVDDIINNDLMLRFEFDEVELLIFSSFLLPPEHQRFFGKYYPWGVFKPRSAKICHLPAGAEHQVGETSKPVRRVEADHDHDDLLFKSSAQESKDYNLRRSLTQPGEGKIDSANT